MKTLTVELPAMYGDHHVIEVRRLLMAMPGVVEVYASSGFQAAEIRYDETKVTPDEIHAQLEKAGYLGQLPIPVEQGVDASQENGEAVIFRHSAVLETVGKDISFAQEVPYAGRPLWPCPGLGTLSNEEKERSHG